MRLLEKYFLEEMQRSRINGLIGEVRTMQIIPSGGALGAEIRGLDISQALDDDTVQAIRQALLDYCVVYFRDQDLSEEDQIRFTNYFGRAVEHVSQNSSTANTKKFFLSFSNIKENGQLIGALGDGEV